MIQIEVLIVEQSSPASAGCADILAASTGMRVLTLPVATVVSPEYEQPHPQVILLTLTGIHARDKMVLADLRDTFAEARIIVVYDEIEEDLLLDYVVIGAIGCIHKSALPTHLDKAVRVVNDGEAWISRRMVASLINRCHRQTGTFGVS